MNYEFNDQTAMSRITVYGVTGQWAAYSSIARVDVNGRHFIGFSAYWEGFVPAIETVLELTTPEVVA